jgi:hypothetical protein
VQAAGIDSAHATTWATPAVRSTMSRLLQLNMMVIGT